MKHKSLCVRLMISAVIFAVISLGGCGGSSTSSVYEDSSKQEQGSGQAQEVSVSMSEVWQDEDSAAEVVDKLTSVDIFLLFTVRMETIEKKSDGSVTMQYYDMTDSVLYDIDSPETPYSSAEVLARYNSGDVIVLMNADLDLVNTVRTDLGLVSEDAGNFGESGIFEAYALSCQRVNGLRNNFTYIVPHFGDMIASDTSDAVIEYSESSDITEDFPDAQNTSPDKAEIIAEPKTLRDFQIDRWTNFLKWLGNMGVMALRNSANASANTVRAAANSDLTSIANAQTHTFDFSYPTFNSTWTIGDYKFSVPRTRNSFVNVTIYSAHSFTSGKDYYVVESITTTVPKDFHDRRLEFNDRGHYTYRNVLYGFTRKASTEHLIDGGSMDVSDIALIRNAPASLNPQTSYSEGMEWGINGSVGIGKDGPSAEVGGSVTFTKSKSWSVSEYSLINDCMTDYSAGAKWYIDVQQPTEGSSNHYVRPFVYWDAVDAVGSSIRELGYETYFMWEAGKNYWKNHPAMKMNVNFSVEDGTCGGWCRNFYKILKRHDSSYTWSKTQSLTLEQPLHTGVSKAHIALTAHSSDQEAFIIYAEDSWVIKNIPSWLHLTDTSGSATGDTGKLILFDVDANTTGSPRSATITISSGRDNVEVQIAQTSK